MALCGIRDAARLLSVSQRHCRRMIAEGRWPYYQIGRRMIRVDVEEIKSFVQRVARGRPIPDSEEKE